MIVPASLGSGNITFMSKMGKLGHCALSKLVGLLGSESYTALGCGSRSVLRTMLPAGASYCQ